MCIIGVLCVFVYVFCRNPMLLFFPSQPGRILQAQTSDLAVGRGLEQSKIRFPNSRMRVWMGQLIVMFTFKKLLETYSKYGSGVIQLCSRYAPNMIQTCTL
jgi:hypothetical protein